MNISGNGAAITPADLLAHSAWLERLACRLVDPATAEDLVQETWATAVRTQPERDRPLRPWLAEVLRNLARMRARSASRWRARAHRLGAGDEPALPSPEELLTFHEAQRLVAEAVAGLDEPYRSTVLLCYAQEIEPAEIARRQGIPGGTVRWRLKRGLEQLRAALDARYGKDRDKWRLMLAPLVAKAAGTGAAAGGGAMAGGTVGAAAAVGVRAAGGAVWKTAGAVAAVAALGAFWWQAEPAGPTIPVASERAPTGAGAGLRPGAGVPRLVVTAPVEPGREAAGAPRPGGAPPAAAALQVVAAQPGAPAADQAEAVRKAIEPGDSPSRGNARAPITIVAYSEFQCPFCARVTPTLRELEQAYPDQIRVVWKHLPLPFHESALLAAEAALAANEQGKFWQMHDRLFAHQDKLDPASLEEHARAIGLDVARFKAALDGAKYKARVEADMKLAKEANITGTPTFFINGEQLTGAQPMAAFKQRIDVALAKLKGLPPPEPPQAMRPPPGAGRPPMIGPGPMWPPVAITLPDNLLGDRIPVRFATGKAPVRGNPRGPVEVLYFTNLADAGGRGLAQGLINTHGKFVKLVAKIVPTTRGPGGPTGPGAPSDLIGAVAHYAHSQGKFWELHDAMPSRFPPPERAELEQIAQKIGLDVDDLRVALDEGRFKTVMEQDREELQVAKLDRPSAFVVNGRHAESPVALAQLVETAMRKAGRRPPPRPPSALPIVTNPTERGYEPQRLMGQLSARQLFGHEPRDSAWAGAVEKAVGPIIDRDLRGIEPGLASTTLECRQTLCRLSWRAGKGDDKVIMAAVRTLYPSFGFAPGEHYMALRLPTGRTPEDAMARIKSRRSTVIYNHKTGRASGKLPFPADRLPKE